MQIKIVDQNLALHPNENAEIEDRTKIILSRYSQRIQSVHLYLCQHVSEVDSKSTECRIDVTLENAEQKQVMSVGHNSETASFNALKRVQRLLSRQLRRASQGISF